jgi:hypothetical protein
MIKIIITAFVLVLLPFKHFSQTPKQVTIRPNVDPTIAFPLKEKYRFPEFRSGFLITLDDKKSQSLKFNFNLFWQKPEFIDAKGDTLLVDDQAIKYVQMREVTYYHDFPKDYYELLLKTEAVTLAIQREWKFIRHDAVTNNGYGETIGISRSQSSTIRTSAGRTFRNEASVFEKDSSYFFIDTKNRIYKASAANTIKIFNDYKNEINNFLKQNEINFKNEADLRKLFDFIIPLAANSK